LAEGKGGDITIFLMRLLHWVVMHGYYDLSSLKVSRT